jgi:hypothetical protein
MITSRENAIIIGTILGDAHLTKTSVRLEITHSEKQKMYLFWKYTELQRFVSAEPYRLENYDERYGKTYIRWKFNTRIDKFFEELYKFFYVKERKIIPKEIYFLLTSPLTLAVWFMDDGGRRNDCYGMFFNTLSFTREENEILSSCLKRNFSLDSRIHWVQDGYRLYIPSKEAKYFCELIHPYIIPSMSYKLSYDPVTTSFARLDRARDRRRKKLL